MLYRVGTTKELPMIRSHLPESVYEEVLCGVAILDCEYGADRNYLLSGGYSLIAQTKDDLLMVKKTIDYDAHCCEWATTIGKDTGYISALYIINDDFSIVIYMPKSIAPDIILTELED